MSTKISLSKAQYETLDKAYKFFNQKLFENKLPDCMLLMQRKGKRNLGYFHPERFVDRQLIDEARSKKMKNSVPRIDELSLNPDNFVGRSDIEIMQTLVHEMAHVWQFRCTDKYPRNGYHDKVWGRQMEAIGLMPSNTGEEGGKRTGQQMMDYPIKGGKFEIACKAFLKSNKIKLTSFPLPAAASTQNKNKTKYTCPSCEMNAWAKPNANIQCGDCDEQMMEV